MSSLKALTLNINGEETTALVEPRMHLADFIRQAGLTGTHIGCEHGVCGACTVMLDGMIVRSCLTLAVQCEGLLVETIEGATDKQRLKDLQENFVALNALQCGFCTAGMLLTADELLQHNPMPSRDEIREYLSGNYCRCTGYQSIVDAIELTAQQRAGKG